MKKISTLKGSSVLLVLVTVVCGAMYNAIGSYVDAQGFLIEPFYLVGIGSFAFIIAVILLVISLMMDGVTFLKKK